MGQEFLETTFDGGADTLLLGIGQESDPPAALRLLADAGRRVRSIFSLSIPTLKISEKVACQRFRVVAAHARSPACSVSHSTTSFLRMESAERDPNTGRSCSMRKRSS